MTKRRLALAFSLAATAPAACTAFGTTAATEPATDGGTPTTDGAAHAIVEAGPIVVPLSDAGFEPDALFDHPHRVGTCADGGWQICDDFEDGQLPTDPVQVKGTLALVQPGSSSSNALEATATKDTKDEAHAFYTVAITEPSPNFVAWSFDFLINSDLLEDTEFGQIDLPNSGNSGNDCFVQPARVGTLVAITEYCQDQSGKAVVDNNRLFAFDISNLNNEWVNLSVAIDFTQKRVDGALLPQSGVLAVLSGRLTQTGTSTTPYLDLGISYVPASAVDSHCELDNFAMDWK